MQHIPLQQHCLTTSSYGLNLNDRQPFSLKLHLIKAISLDSPLPYFSPYPGNSVPPYPHLDHLKFHMMVSLDSVTFPNFLTCGQCSASRCRCCKPNKPRLGLSLVRGNFTAYPYNLPFSRNTTLHYREMYCQFCIHPTFTAPHPIGHIFSELLCAVPNCTALYSVTIWKNGLKRNQEKSEEL